jgi:hypothetical protein
VKTTITIPFDPGATVAIKPRKPTSDQRYSAIRMWLSLADLFETMGEPARARYWRNLAEGAGWKPDFGI